MATVGGKETGVTNDHLYLSCIVLQRIIGMNEKKSNYLFLLHQHMRVCDHATTKLLQPEHANTCGSVVKTPQSRVSAETHLYECVLHITARTCRDFYTKPIEVNHS